MVVCKWGGSKLTFWGNKTNKNEDVQTAESNAVYFIPTTRMSPGRLGVSVSIFEWMHIVHFAVCATFYRRPLGRRVQPLLQEHFFLICAWCFTILPSHSFSRPACFCLILTSFWQLLLVFRPFDIFYTFSFLPLLGTPPCVEYPIQIPQLNSKLVERGKH